MNRVHRIGPFRFSGIGCGQYIAFSWPSRGRMMARMFKNPFWPLINWNWHRKHPNG